MFEKNAILFGSKRGLVTGRMEENQWQETNRFLDGFPITGIATRGRVILAASTNGLFESVDGESWSESNTGLEILKIRAIAQHPNDPEFVIVGTEPANIFVSSDFGDTWRKGKNVENLRDEFGWFLPYSPQAGCVRGFAFQDNRIYAAAEEGGVLFSDDNGKTWQLVPGSSGEPEPAKMKEGEVHPDVHAVFAYPPQASTILAVTGGGLFRTQNRGETWENLYRCYCRELWINPDRPDHWVFGPAEGVDYNGRLVQSHNAGQDWYLMDCELEQPFADTMAELFVHSKENLFCVLSDGRVLYAESEKLEWKVIPDVETILTAEVIH